MIDGGGESGMTIAVAVVSTSAGAPIPEVPRIPHTPGA